MRPGPAQLKETAAAVRAPRIITAGESMALVIPGVSGRLRHATQETMRGLPTRQELTAFIEGILEPGR